MKIAFISLGCSKNQSDLEYLIGDMVAEKFSIVNTIEKADAIVINTCGFLQSAVKEAIDNIFDVVSKKKKGAKVIVSGCMVERYRDEIVREIPEVDFFTGVGELHNIIDYLKGEDIKKKVKRYYGKKRLLVNPPYYAYLKIAEGCNNRCSYCTIPSIRGGLVSRDMDDIIEEARGLLSSGVKELILISQDTTKYGLDKSGSGLMDLLEKITELDGDFKVRLLYLNPDGVDEKLIDFVANNDKILKYFEIPVQHINDRILKLMNRRSDSKKIKDVFGYIREKVSDAFIRTTFIVGFPSETEEEFEEIATFIEQYKPDYSGFFPYSKEEGTKAFLLNGEVPKRVVRQRISKLQKLQRKITIDRLKMMKKQDIKIFVEKPSEDIPFIFEGRAEFQAPEIDGKTYIIDGEIDNGYGPYIGKIKRVIYPDIYCAIKRSEG
ncbi:MAG: 30S ribosomal protein S12 methylthiotransferase RimO [Deferribacterales bacterium]